QVEQGQPAVEIFACDAHDEPQIGLGETRPRTLAKHGRLFERFDVRVRQGLPAVLLALGVLTPLDLLRQVDLLLGGQGCGRRDVAKEERPTCLRRLDTTTARFRPYA